MFSDFGSLVVGKIWGSISMDSKMVEMEALTFIYNYYITIITYSSIIIGDGEIDETWGVKKGLDNFLATEDGGGVFSIDESIIKFFPLSFLEIIEWQ